MSRHIAPPVTTPLPPMQAQAQQPAKEQKGFKKEIKVNALYDHNLATHGDDPHYWYSVEDGYRLVFWYRMTYLFNLTSASVDIPSVTENERHVFLADPYSEGNFANSFNNDLSKIKQNWHHGPQQIIIPLITLLHWITIKIDINYETGVVSVLFHDPYGLARKTHVQQLIQNLSPHISSEVNGLFARFASGTQPEIKYFMKDTDQQGYHSNPLNRNSWDCGAINFSNIENYLSGVSPLTIPTAVTAGHAKIISETRQRHRLIFSEVSGVTLAKRLTFGDYYQPFKGMDFNHPITELITDAQLPLFIGLLEDARFFAKSSKSGAYTDEELMAASKQLQYLTAGSQKSPRKPEPISTDDPIFLYLCALSRYDLRGPTDSVQAEHFDYVFNRKGWQILTHWEEPIIDYRGIAIYHPSLKIIVIIHRGTKVDPAKGVVSIPNIEADFAIAKGEVPGNIVNSAIFFGNEVYTEARKKGLLDCQFYHTGFSLGGFLASIVGAYYEKLYPAANGVTLCIDSPGSWPAAKKLIKDGRIVNNRAKTIDYIIKPPNLVGMCNTRMAREVRMVENSLVRYTLSPALKKLSLGQDTSTAHLFELLELLKSHDLNQLIDSTSKLTSGKIQFKSTQLYQVCSISPKKGKEALNIKELMLVKGQELFGGFFGFNLEREKSFTKFMAHTISPSLTVADPHLKPCQDALDHLHKAYGVCGVDIGPPQVHALHYGQSVLKGGPKTTNDIEFLQTYHQGLKKLEFWHYQEAINHFDSVLKTNGVNKVLGTVVKDDEYSKIIADAYLRRGEASLNIDGDNEPLNKMNHALAFFDCHLAFHFKAERLQQAQHYPSFIKYLLPGKDFKYIGALASKDYLQEVLNQNGLDLDAVLMVALYRAELRTIEYVLRELKYPINKKLSPKGLLAEIPNFQGGYSLLHFAAGCGFLDIVRFLLANGADWDAITIDGRTAYGLAMQNGHDEVALLIEEFISNTLNVQSAHKPSGTISPSSPFHHAPSPAVAVGQPGAIQTPEELSFTSGPAAGSGSS